MSCLIWEHTTSNSDANKLSLKMMVLGPVAFNFFLTCKRQTEICKLL